MKNESVQIRQVMCGRRQFLATGNHREWKYYLNFKRETENKRSFDATRISSPDDDTLVIEERRDVQTVWEYQTPQSELFVYKSNEPQPSCGSTTLQDHCSGFDTTKCTYDAINGGKPANSERNIRYEYTGTATKGCIEALVVDTCEENGIFCTCTTGIYDSERFREPKPDTTNTVEYTSWDVYTENRWRNSSTSSLTATLQVSNFSRTTLSDEEVKYTESEFRDFALGRLEESSGSESSSAKFLYPNNTGTSIGDFNQATYVIRHHPSITCYLKVWLRVRFVATKEIGEPEADPVFQNLPPYVWNPSGSGPCIEDPEVGLTDTTGFINSPEYVIPPPESPGTSALEIIKYSFLEDYEPDDPDENNIRPSPDNKPNGFPAP